MRAGSQRTAGIMKRFVLVIGLLGLAASLSGCDKCGDFQPLFGIGSKSCSGGKQAG